MLIFLILNKESLKEFVQKKQAIECTNRFHTSKLLDFPFYAISSRPIKHPHTINRRISLLKLKIS
uniref:Uncharacterized protein n=1 Tax=Cannabis sativa TaxID=3483 RepID=A0A803R0P0_CANSA